MPDEDARREIFEIHTRDRQLADDVDFEALVDRTDGFVGADVEAICRDAAQIAVREYVHRDGEGETGPDSVDELEVTMDHFETALAETEPIGFVPAT
ncbi:MAG: hypothetical protein ACQETB_02610 [Halobacteriota archaeon]